MTGRQVRITYRAQYRLLYPAAVEDIGAARVEAAAAGRIDRAGHIAGQDDTLAPCRRIGDRNRGQQGACIGMVRLSEQAAPIG